MLRWLKYKLVGFNEKKKNNSLIIIEKEYE